MSELEIEESPGASIVAWIFNILTILVLLAALCFGGYVLAVFLNPQSGFNLFPPPTLPPTAAPPTATPPAAQQLPPTFTPEPPTEIPLPTATGTPEASRTPTASPTQFLLMSLTPVAVTQAETDDGMPFVLQERNPILMQNFAHPEAGCNWSGVAGQVLDMSGNPIVGLIVELGGSLSGQPIGPDGAVLSLTGTALQYGQAGYEFQLPGSKPITSNGTLFIQLLDQANLPLSDKIFFDTSEQCDQNLVLINFRQVRQ